MMRPFIPVLESWGLLAAYGKREEHAMRYGRLAPISHSMLFSFTDAYARTFGNLLIVRMQLVQMFTGRFTPSISTRRCCTLRTKRRRVRRCEWLTLLPCIGLRPQISQRPDIHYSSLLFSSLYLKPLTFSGRVVYFPCGQAAGNRFFTNLPFGSKTFER